MIVEIQAADRDFRTSFTDKVWWGTTILTPEEFIEEGNIRQFPFTGIPGWKCKLDTNGVVKTTAELISAVAANKEAKLKPGACLCVVS